MAQEKVLDSKRVSYGYVQLVEVFGFPGSISYWVKVDGQLKYGSYANLSDAQSKFSSL